MSDQIRIVLGLFVAGVLSVSLPAFAQDETAAEPVAEEAVATTEEAPAEESPTEEARESTGVAEEGEVYIGGMGVYRSTDRDFVDYGAGLNFIYGTVRNDKWNHEWVFSGTINETDSSASDFYRYAFGWDALYFLDREGIQPYLVAGLGIHHNEILEEVGGDESGVYANAGVGFLKPLQYANLGLALRGDLRLVHDSGVSETDVAVGLGLQMALSRPQPASPASPLVPVASGDSDGDGVPDNLDKCPGTLPGLKVDETGCAIPQVFVLKGVSFDFDSTRLGVNAQTILEDVVKTMQGQPTMKVEIAGHTDNYGSEEYNRDLSQRRADAVKDYLISKGISSDSLRATGYGEAQPVASNDNDFDREQNRRVEFRIESQ
jgi:OOP family OmpA-OmpF porin